jgi:aminopeptidase N
MGLPLAARAATVPDSTTRTPPVPRAEPSMHRVLARVLGLLLAVTATAALAQARFDFDRNPTILPKTVVPSKVRLHLDLDPARDRFDGRVAIDVTVRQPVRAIVLHAKELEPSALLLRSGGATRALQLVASDIPDTWRLQPRDGLPIAAGPARLELSYRGKVQASGQGLFVVEHMVDGHPARMLATQLEPIAARRVLPCFDEPVFRTVFEVEVDAPPGDRVLSNAPLRSTTPHGDRVLHRFAPTPPMQSYLLSVAVGHFDVLEDQVDGIPLRIFTAPGKREQARFAMESTRQVLHWYGEYFGRRFELPKLDQLAVPGVRNGAMEDWGMISYEETLLLHDPRRSRPAQRQAVFSVLAHEIAHQWFGDLVSPAGWSDIWLNEAFATWMENKAIERFHPEWETALQRREWLEGALDRDATHASRAIRSGPVAEAAVFDVFDDITYDKGGAVLSMLEQWLGPETFRRGLAAYMRERALHPATAGDLWHHMAAAAQLPVARVASVWADVPGVPVVQLDASCQAGQTQVTMRRERFSTLDALPPQPWQVPTTVDRGGVVRTVLVGDGTATAAFPGCDPLPIVGNAGAAGYYRVDPAPALRLRLVQSLPALAPVDRIALLGDSFALTAAGRRPLQDHLALLAAVPQVQGEGRAQLVHAALDQWRHIAEAFAGTPAGEALRRTQVSLLAPELQRLGWTPAPDEPTTTAELRSSLVVWLARLGDEPTQAAVAQRCTAAIDGDMNAVAPSLRPAILQACGMHATDAQFDAMHAALLSTASVEEQRMFLRALAASADPARARRLLEEGVAGKLPGSLGGQLVWFMEETPGLGPVVYDFTVAHWSALATMVGDMSSRWLLPAALGWAATSTQAETMLRDQARLAGTPGQAAAESVIAGIRVRERVRDREAGRLSVSLRP